MTPPDGWTDEGVGRFLRALFDPTSAEYLEVHPMSIQIAGGNHPATRAEVVDRLRASYAAHAAALMNGGQTDEERAQGLKAFRDTVGSFFFALVGTHASADELDRMTGAGE